MLSGLTREGAQGAVVYVCGHKLNSYAGGIRGKAQCDKQLNCLLSSRSLELELGAFTIYKILLLFYFSRPYYCTKIFFANTPFIVQYIAQYYQLLHPPGPHFEVFLRCLEQEFYCFLEIGFWTGRGVPEKNPCQTRKRAGHY